MQSTQNANNSKTLQELDAVKNENHTLQQELQAARVHYTELQKELKAIREERDSLKLALQIVSKDCIITHLSCNLTTSASTRSTRMLKTLF